MADIQSFLAGAQQLAEGVTKYTPTLAMATGLVFAARGAYLLFKRSNHTQGNDDSVSGFAIAIHVLVGAFLLGFADFTQNMVGLSDTGLRASTAYQVVGGGATWDLATKVFGAWLLAIGTVSVYRGLLKLIKAGSGRSQGPGDELWAAIYHLFGGGVLISMTL